LIAFGGEAALRKGESALEIRLGLSPKRLSASWAVFALAAGPEEEGEAGAVGAGEEDVLFSSPTTRSDFTNEAREETSAGEDAEVDFKKKLVCGGLICCFSRKMD